MTHKTDDATLIADLRVLAHNLEHGHGQANLVIAAAADRLERIRAFISALCLCPCCESDSECASECTFKTDCPEHFERMNLARMALK